ncbi:4-hydroxybenzoate 3-monooxygenase [Streptomyces sp. NPDC127098]|uniref:4-hydroxybenzoate 3-monooxygenase n=1 Tax=Streptomyces sp. NPDC127098 TaxID=3347137 RepID=UPI00365F3DFA
MHTTVAVVGAGPAGLLLARLLHARGVDCVVLESRDRDHVERRQRAGMLEQGTVDALRDCGAGARMDREGLVHDGIELRFDGRAHRVDFPALTGGRRVMVYAQTELVKDLIGLQLAEGPPLLFEAPVTGVSDVEGPRLTVHYRRNGEPATLTCDYVVGCDGYHGVTRRAIPAGERRVFERGHPYSWFAILADVAPSCEELVYAHSPRGFALHSMRSPRVSRLYFQVPNGTDPATWSDEEIWAELAARLETVGDWRLRTGPITARAVLPMRSWVTEPMCHGRLFLAGDAAHIVPPTGAKGLNLAVADVVELARAFDRLLAEGSPDLLDAYSDTRLRAVWRAEHFSALMTSALHLAPDQDPFTTRLQLAWLHRLADSPHAAAELATNYAG